MELLRKVSIRNRVNVAMGLTAVTLGLLGGGGYLAVSRAQQDFAGFAQQHLPLVVAVGQARQALGHLVAFDETDVAINYSVPSEAQRYAEQGLQLLDKAQAPLKALVGDVSGSGSGAKLGAQAEVIKQAAERLVAYRQQVEPVYKAAADSKLQSAAAGKRALEGAKDKLKQAEAMLGQLGGELDTATQTMTHDIAARNAASSRALAILAPLAIALLLPLMWATLRSILVPLVRSREVAARIARGELSVDITDHGRDETGELLRTLAAMQDGLRGMVSAIRETAQFVSTASNEIAAGNLDLSQRTENTASGLEAAASGMATLTDQLMDSARSAQQAGQLAVQAAEVTVSGGRTVSAVEGLMSEIAASSRRIAEIVDVVDGIARRTNILALNAGVEAARAGDQGRGFAVVAQEVRTLSLRVAESAQQIKALVDQAAQQVRQGTDQSRQAGSTMNKVVDTARAVSGAMQGVADAVSGQSREMARVNDAVMQLDKLTQQNSALVEETAAAASGLRDQAQRLETLVGAFKLPA
jgi:methyl-accepting chemotaxis protein